MSNFSLLLCDSAARIGLDNLFQISRNQPQLAETRAGQRRQALVAEDPCPGSIANLSSVPQGKCPNT